MMVFDISKVESSAFIGDFEHCVLLAENDRNQRALD